MTVVPPAGANPPLEAHRLLGDGRTTALVRDDGEIDWWCAPLPHADPLLWSLLDPSGSAARFLDTRPAPVEEAGRVDDPRPPIAGPVLDTVLVTVDGRIGVRDALVPAAAGGSALVRLVRSLDGPVTVRHGVRAGGFGSPVGHWSGPEIAVNGLTWRFHAAGAPMHESDGELTVELHLDRDAVALILTADPTFDVRLANVVARLDDADEDERKRVARCATSVLLPHRQRDALAVLQACTHQPTGAVVASPTTSLPEAVDADRQFDYRYSWLRDGSLAAAVAAVVGEDDATSAYLGFLEGLGPDRLLHAPVWTVEGEPVPDERVIPFVAGWAGSQPVRTGNAAKGQLQYDALGFVAEAIGIYVREGGALTAPRWALVEAVADRAATGAAGPTAGIWEMREPELFVAADIGRWMALDHAVRLADRDGRDTPPAWASARDRCRRHVLDAIRADGLLPQVHPGHHDGEPRADASALLAIICRLVDPDDPRADGVIDRCLDLLGTGPFLHRYPPDATDGFHGREGAFLPASFWAVTALATVGRIDEATDRLLALDAALPSLLSEEWSVDDGRALGNIPLVWSHIELVRALYALESAAI